MALGENFELVPLAAFHALMAEATRRLANLPRVESRYRNLAQVACIHQEFGNALSRQIYAAASEARGPRLACVVGCSTCCFIPSIVRGSATSNFTMTLLDMVTLVEHYDEIKSGDASLFGKALRSVEEARTTKDIGPCPYLTSSGACGIYAHRPVTCKIWFSFDLGLCIQNRQRGYPVGVNAFTDESNRLRAAFEKPFAEYVDTIAPDMEFSGHDFLLSFEEVARLGSLGLLQTLKEKIDAREQNTWEPFGPTFP